MCCGIVEWNAVSKYAMDAALGKDSSAVRITDSAAPLCLWTY